MAKPKAITVRGAGVAGLWCALLLARGDQKVTLVERSEKPFVDACSFYAGAMLAPYCEEEVAEALIRELGLRSIEMWRETYPETEVNGSLIVAPARDRRELDRFARVTTGHERVDAEKIAELEPDLADRFASGLYFAGEGHLHPHRAMAFILEQAQEAGVTVRFGETAVPKGAELVVDCRGLAARDDLPELRGVRGERLVIRTGELHLNRPVRLLHPRFPLYVVPWGHGFYLVGATQIESEEEDAVSVRSALELLSTAYALHPAFGEAEIVSFAAGVRPAFPDNRPRIVVRDDHIYVNGLFRHGFLLAPALAELTVGYIKSGATHPEVFL
jgi:glycine oxidase